jgi:hypothetical protein
MCVKVPDELARQVLGLLLFVAEVCDARHEELNVALCLHTRSYYPAHHLQEELLEAAKELTAAIKGTEVVP